MKASDFIKKKGKTASKGKGGGSLMDWISKKNQSAKAMAGSKSSGKK